MALRLAIDSEHVAAVDDNRIILPVLQLVSLIITTSKHGCLLAA